MNNDFTEKAPAIENIMEGVAGRRREIDHCVFEDDDGHHDLAFRDDISRREFAISGMCQVCQDQMWPE